VDFRLAAAKFKLAAVAAGVLGGAGPSGLNPTLGALFHVLIGAAAGVRNAPLD